MPRIIAPTKVCQKSSLHSSSQSILEWGGKTPAPSCIADHVYPRTPTLVYKYIATAAPPVPTALCSPYSSLKHALLTPSSSLHYPLSTVLPSSSLCLYHMHCLPSLPPFLTHAYGSASSFLPHSLLIHSSYCPLSCSLPHPLTTPSPSYPCSSLTVSPPPLDKAKGHCSTFSLTHVFPIFSSFFPYAFSVPSSPLYCHALLTLH